MSRILLLKPGKAGTNSFENATNDETAVALLWKFHPSLSHTRVPEEAPRRNRADKLLLASSLESGRSGGDFNDNIILMWHSDTQM